MKSKRTSLASCKATVANDIRAAFDRVRKRDQISFAKFVAEIGINLLAFTNDISLEDTETHIHIDKAEGAVAAWREPARPVVDLLHEDDTQDQGLILLAAIASHAHDMKVPIEAVVDGVLIQLGNARNIAPGQFN